MIFGPLGATGGGTGSVKMASGTVENVNEIEVGFKPYAIWFSYLKASSSGATLNGNQVLVRPEDSDSYMVSYRQQLETIYITITFTDTGISVSRSGLDLPFFEDYTYYWFAIG